MPENVCSRENCPSDSVPFETFVSREMRAAVIQYTCDLCGAIYAETYQSGRLVSVEYLTPRGN